MSQVNAEGAGARLWRAVKRFPFILVTTFVVGCLVGWWVIAPAMAAEQGVPGIEMG